MIKIVNSSSFSGERPERRTVAKQQLFNRSDQSLFSRYEDWERLICRLFQIKLQQICKVENVLPDKAYTIDEHPLKFSMQPFYVHNSTNICFVKNPSS